MRWERSISGVGAEYEYVDDWLEGNFDGERDCTINWIKDRGCCPKLSNGGRSDWRLDSIAREGVAVRQTC